MNKNNSIMMNNKKRFDLERIIKFLLLISALIAVLSIIVISIYIFVVGSPILINLKITDFLLSKVWDPNNLHFGVLPMILASLMATLFAVVLSVPIGVLVAVFLTKIATKKISNLFRVFIRLMVGIPSVVYGLLGAMIIVPMTFKLQTKLAIPTSGNLLAVIIVLIIMLLPTIISVSESAILSIPKEYEEAALALGATKIESIFKVVIPAAKSGIITGAILGVGRAIGETMAVIMVAGNAVMMPEFLKPVRLLTAAIPLEWAYSSGIHRDALYGIGLILFIFIMIINILISQIIKRGTGKNE